jgi:zinc/manganese transport system substrate-binding protein
MKVLGPILSATVAALLFAGCAGSSGSAATAADGRLQVVAAESVWGSIASQLGGPKVAVQSVIVNPNTDPHSYEPRADDAIAFARSQMAIVNGIGYDAWASKLIDSNPSSSRTVLDVGDLLGLGQGDNPHQWYSPSAVERVADRIAADYKRLDPKDAAYFDHQADGGHTGPEPSDRGVGLQPPERDARRAARQPACAQRARRRHDDYRDALACVG